MSEQSRGDLRCAPSSTMCGLRACLSVTVTNAWIYNTVHHFLVCFCVCPCASRAIMTSRNSVCVCYCEYESVCMSNARMQKESSSSATSIWENVSTIFNRAAALISKAKQTGPGLWPTQRPLCEPPRATSVAAKRRVQGSGNERLKKSRERSRMRKGDGSPECPH